MNKLEDYIKNNRELFDDQKPSQETDKLIFGYIKKNKNGGLIRKIKFYSIAAAVIFIVATSALFSSGYLEKYLNEQEIASVIPDYNEAESYYAKKIKMARSTLQLSTDTKNLESDFVLIDRMVVELKNELTIAPKIRKKIIAKRIISVYKNEIKLLNKIIAKTKNIS